MALKSPTVLLTGRNGFIARHLTSRLKANMHVVSLLRRPDASMAYTDETLLVKDALDLTAADIVSNGVDIIAHLAGMYHGGSPRQIEEANTRLSKHIFEMAQEAGVPVLYLSTANVIFKDSLGVYARAKARCEDILRNMNIGSLIVRVPLVLGCDSPSVAAIKIFYKRMHCMPLFGPSRGLTEPVGIKALSEYLAKALLHGLKQKEKRICILIGEEAYTYKELLRGIIKKEKVRFFCVPYDVGLRLAGIWESLGGAPPVSSEEIRSVNLDKRVPRASGEVMVVGNSWDILME